MKSDLEKGCLETVFFFQIETGKKTDKKRKSPFGGHELFLMAILEITLQVVKIKTEANICFRYLLYEIEYNYIDVFIIV